MAAAVSFCLRNFGPDPIGRYVWHFISLAISLVADSVAIDTVLANHISTTRFVSDSTMKLLVCFLTSLSRMKKEPLACIIKFVLGANITRAGWLAYSWFQVLHSLTEIETWVLSRFGLRLVLFLGSFPICVGGLGYSKQEYVFLWERDLCVSVLWVSACHHMFVQ